MITLLLNFALLFIFSHITASLDCYLALKDIDFTIADVEVVTHFVQLGGESIALLSCLQRDLRLLFDQSIFLLQSLTQFLHLRNTTTVIRSGNSTFSRWPIKTE